MATDLVRIGPGPPLLRARFSLWSPLIARLGPRFVPGRRWLWLAVFSGIALYAQRGVAWWSLAAVPAVAGVPHSVDGRAYRVLRRRINPTSQRVARWHSRPWPASS